MLCLKDLANDLLGSSIVSVSDEFFAKAENMLRPHEPVHRPGYIVDTGYWMDGWESKRHCRTHDWVIIKFGFPGIVRGFDIDTRYFIGDHASAAAVEGAFVLQDHPMEEEIDWTPVLPQVSLTQNSHNVFVLSAETSPFTHLRLNNIPDGGIARFRVYGNVYPIITNNNKRDRQEAMDLAFVGNGARVVSVSNEFYTAASHLLLPGRGANMGDGWQTNRSREANHSDSVIIRLAVKGHVYKIEIDTSHFIGNYPEKITLEGTDSSCEVPKDTSEWTVIADRVKTGPHGVFFFDALHHDKAFTHIRLTIIPDGGLKRVRLWGVRQGRSLPYPLPTPKEPNMIAQPLTSEAFLPYGEVIEARPTISLSSANQGTAQKHHHVAHIVNHFADNKGMSHMSVFHCSPATQLPFTIKLLERHPYSSQAFIPMTDGKVRGYFVAVALNGKDDRPDMSTLKTFIASSLQGINYGKGVWHHPMVSLEHATSFACLVHENGVPDDDCQIVDVEPVTIEIPGYRAAFVQS
ncbi:galactose-binding domain-like protein [Spinellus fusiger]|nr:galactose-binding domain-like protein [Spinellus fusiger]